MVKWNHGNPHFIGACMVIYGHMRSAAFPGPSLLGNGINAF